MLLNDYTPAAYGRNQFGQCNIPSNVLKDVNGKLLKCVQVSAGCDHSVLLREDGRAFAWGFNGYGQIDIPPPSTGERYTQVFAGSKCTVLLQTDGSAIVCGQLDETIVPYFQSGGMYAAILANTPTSANLVLLLHTGYPVHVGRCRFQFSYCECESVQHPIPESGQRVVSVSAAINVGPTHHLALLNQDGTVTHRGENRWGQCNVPALDEGVRYTQVSTSGRHLVLLRSDGIAVACGDNSERQCDIPNLEEGTVYTEVSAGNSHTLLLRSDGVVVAVGNDSYRQCFRAIPIFVRALPAAGISVRATPDLVVLMTYSGEAVYGHRMCVVRIFEIGGIFVGSFEWPLTRKHTDDDSYIRSQVQQVVRHMRKSQHRRLVIVQPDGTPLFHQWSPQDVGSADGCQSAQVTGGQYQ